MSFKIASEGFALMWSLGRKRLSNFSRLYLRQYRQSLNIFVVVSNPVNYGIPVLPELLRSHVVALLRQSEFPFLTHNDPSTMRGPRQAHKCSLSARITPY